MSSQKGNVKKGGPAHQNTFAYKHHKNDLKAIKMHSLPNEGLCQHCHEIIEWKKKYNKYKPITKPGTCTKCLQKTITRSYHTICQKCCGNLKVCGKCGQEKAIVNKPTDAKEEQQKENALQKQLALTSERKRKTILRQLEKDPNLFASDSEDDNSEEEEEGDARDANGESDGSERESDQSDEIEDKDKPSKQKQTSTTTSEGETDS
eukprot:TRINITY_DN5855_c0_g3_i1.p1 TRINITY_DN5855_c0_g3~~TRINITY_DN5855_c0_g3_i1.p1  ORF type:complete len:221 (+),score=36.38 TRINITY_DN5855_c0_g3_i1:46-663(+)